MEVTFSDSKSPLKVEEKLRSIFDSRCAGDTATDGAYYCIHVDHNTQEEYAVPRDAAMEYYRNGRTLMTDEKAEFFGEKVRGMTLEEEEAWNMDQLDTLIDVWGNVIDTEEDNDKDEKSKN